MLFHASIEADNPQRVATALAKLWEGKALPFPPVAKGSWAAFANDDRNSAIEVYPRGTELRIAEGNADAGSINVAGKRFGATHLAIATVLDAEEVLSLAEREAWPARICHRGGMFHVIEIWIEGCQMIEVLTAEMQREYLENISVEKWEQMVAATAAQN